MQKLNLKSTSNIITNMSIYAHVHYFDYLLILVMLPQMCWNRKNVLPSECKLH